MSPSPEARIGPIGAIMQKNTPHPSNILDEMLAICSDIETWHKKKSAEEANAKYNEILYYGLETDDGENY